MNDQVRPLSANASSSDAGVGNSRNSRELIKEHGVPALIGLVTVIVITAIMMTFDVYFVKDHLIFFYLFPITGIAMYYNSTPALVTSFISSLGTAYFLFPPVFSLRMSEPLQIVELLLFSILAFIASKASSRLMR